MSRALLEIEDLTVAYRSEDGRVTTAAEGVTLSLDRGESLCVVGESGSGKSSVAMSVARLLPSPPAFWPKGRILFDGEDVLAMDVARLRELRGRRIGVIFQDPMGSLSPLHRIADQLVETVFLHERMAKASAREFAVEWLGKVGVDDPARVARAYPHELSGGQQQRVMIAMAMMLGPDLLVADEPTTALDVTVQKQILALMRGLVGEKGALLMITHDLGVVSEMATKLAVMKDGRVIETAADVREFFRRPQHPHSQALVAEARKMELE
ncbi:MAG: ABC transporter ATP-binding protein [Kiritimatiellae bacterium]|nr:ABC transporter ATP-binding protein [Kiritimatiellia bacterium]